MIGHFLLTLIAEQEDRVLTESFEPYVPEPYVPDLTTRRCVIDVALDRSANTTEAVYFPFRPGAPWAQCGLAWVGRSYDRLCMRFGSPRVNAAIRNRILSNRARRILGNPSRDTAGVGECRFGRGE